MLEFGEVFLINWMSTPTSIHLILVLYFHQIWKLPLFIWLYKDRQTEVTITNYISSFNVSRETILYCTVLVSCHCFLLLIYIMVRISD